MGIFGDASNFQIVALIMLIVAFIIDLVGFAAPYWIHYSKENTVAYASIYKGLWQLCGTVEVKLLGTSTTKCASISSSETRDWFKAVQAFGCLGFLCLLVAVVCAGLKMFILKDRRDVFMASIMATFAGVICIFLSVVIYGTKKNENAEISSFTFHYAFVFCIIGMIAAIVAGALSIFDMVKGGRG